MKMAFVSISDASDSRLHSGTSSAMLRHFQNQGLEIEPIFPLHRQFKYLFSGHVVKATLTGGHFAMDRHPFALKRYAAEIHKVLSGRRVDLVFSNSSIPLTFLQCRTPKAFWTDAIWHDMAGYYGGAFARPTDASDRNARQQEVRSLNNVQLAVYTSRWAAATASTFTNSEKVKVVPRGANIAVNHSLQDIEEWIKVRDASPVCNLLFVGVDWERKGGDTAIKTAGQLIANGIPTRLTIIGSGPRCQLPDFVQALGYVPTTTVRGMQTMAGELRKADFLLLPTRAEAGGIVFCEASAYGVPSLTYKTGGVGEYVRDGKNGYALGQHSGPSDFAARIAGLIADRHSYARLAKQSFQEYKTRLNWDVSIKSLITLLEATVENHYNAGRLLQ